MPQPPNAGWKPDEMVDFIGGTLRGVLEKLDHIADLGATVIWLSPIFVTPTYHGYDTTHFTQLDPRFGTEADLRALIDAAHQRGIRVLLDFVANHVSLDFAPFVAAKDDPDSPYRPWFHFGDEYTHGYQSFFNVPTMPKLDVDHPQVRHHLFAAARYWLTEFGVDGYRLDYAAGPSHAFWSDFYAACKSVNPDCWIFGEITLPSDQLRTYVGRMDGTLDFGLARAIRRVCVDDGGGDGPDLSLSHFAAFIERHHAHFPPEFVLPGFVDNHDMNRFLWVVGNDKRRLALGRGAALRLWRPAHPLLRHRGRPGPAPQPGPLSGRVPPPHAVGTKIDRTRPCCPPSGAWWRSAKPTRPCKRGRSAPCTWMMKGASGWPSAFGEKIKC